MKILVISDLHIGNGSPFNTFGWRDQDFISRLELYRELYRIDLVVLNGDIFEMYKYSINKIYENHRKLLDYFFIHDFILLRGNHDSCFSGSMDELTLVNSSGKLIHFEHGHRADIRGYKAVMGLHRICFRFLKFSALLGSIHLCLHYLVRKNENFDRIKYRKKKYQKYGKQLLDGLYDVVVLGHTHRMESFEHNNVGRIKLLLNSGTCSQGRFQAVVLDTETLDYFFIKDGSPKSLDKNPVVKMRELEAVV